MLAPTLTAEWFEECTKRGLSAHKTIGKFNSKNCKKDFSKTIPKALLEEGWNAFLIIKNHKERWKYMGFNVNNIAGALHIVDNPEIAWAGYVLHGGTWYAVSSDDILKGRIPASRKIIYPQIEYSEEPSEPTIAE